ncbi:MAG: hypothetical protein F4X83_10670, partial [Chloroflexi bacterium]|nr:hypothetical protein [Chloroflexota bacterium]
MRGLHLHRHRGVTRRDGRRLRRGQRCVVRVRRGLLGPLGAVVTCRPLHGDVLLRRRRQLDGEGRLADRPDPTPAALYARVSSDRQDVDLSVSAQLRALRAYAAKHNYVVVREYVDEA